MDGLAALGLASVINALDKFKGGSYLKAENTNNFTDIYHHALNMIQFHIRCDEGLTNSYISLCRTICKKGETLWEAEKPADEDDDMNWM